VKVTFDGDMTKMHVVIDVSVIGGKKCFFSSHLKAMQREFLMLSTNMHILRGRLGVQQRWLRVENFKQKKKSSKKGVVQVFYSKSRWRIFSGKSMFRKNKSSTCKSLYVRSHIECEKRNSAVS